MFGAVVVGPQDDFCSEARQAASAQASLCRFYEEVGRPVSNSYPRERTFFGAEIDAAFGMSTQFMPADR
jgi:hypothetical protein